MKKQNALITTILLCSSLLILMGCTSNPLGEDEISPGSRKIMGAVELENNTPGRVFVWLDGFNQGTFTEPDGSFSLTLPRGNDDVSGVFRLYFYVANYELDFVEVVVKDGSFEFGQAALNSRGELRAKKRLKQFLEVSTRVTPSVVNANATTNINITVALRTVDDVDSATVVFPNTTAGFLGPVFFQNVETEEVFIFQGLPGVSTKEVVLIGLAGLQRSLTLPFVSLNLPPANYEVIPYILVKHEVVPQELIESIGANIETLGPNYLRLPFERVGGDLLVQE
ncbi:MAG: hypothetical protein ACE5NG_13470 [bacterium]